MKSYQDFLANKFISDIETGLEKTPKLNQKLFGFQKDIVSWALRRGRAAIFADCGMGKTPMQLEWARHVPGNVLILAPLAVSEQTVSEGKKFDVEVKYARSQKEVEGKITITNYEMLHHFESQFFNAVVLDESSILKSYTGKFRNLIIESFAKTPFKLACTATPAPNDFMELGNHSEFLQVMSRTEMLSMFFVHDGGETQKWRLKGHAEGEYWRWVCSWAVMVKKPSDLGYPDEKFKLPEVNFHEISVDSVGCTEDYLFLMPAATLQERISARRSSVKERCDAIAEIINKSKEPWLVWCNLNSEGDYLQKILNDSIQVKGSDSREQKTERMLGFTSGDIRVMVSKVSICGYGMNWQHCRNVAFVGLSDSYEDFYQALRRCWRFGQKKPVNCYIIIADNEGAVLSNIKRKERDAEKMAQEMVKNMHDVQNENIKASKKERTKYRNEILEGKKFKMILGDCVEELKKIESGMIHYSIFSPPFASLYTYSNSERDMGNCKSYSEFFTHFKFMLDELYRVLMPGRLVSFHCMNLPTSKASQGYIGIRDFRGDLIRDFESSGFIYHSEVCIWKDPVIAMQRTKALGLLHKQIKKDSAMSRQGIADYLVTMRKPGENDERITHTNESFPVSVWQRYASPVWMDINPSDTLQYRSARDHKDERHICPLQLEVIRRAIDLWTNEEDIILSPFAGIGSEGYAALLKGRRFIGIELKQSYFNQAVKNLAIAENEFKSQFLINC